MKTIQLGVLLLLALGGLTACNDNSSSSPPLPGQSANAPPASGGGGQPGQPGESVLEAPLISGTESWVNGRHVWTDYAYDDRGRNPSAPYPTVSYQVEEFSGAIDLSAIVGGFDVGDLLTDMLAEVPLDVNQAGVYPSDELANAADLIQLTLERVPGGLQITALLQTLNDPAVPLLGVGIDLDGDPATGAAALPTDSWAVSGGPLGLEKLFVIEHGQTRILTWQEGDWQESEGPLASFDTDRNTITVTIPEAELQPGGDTWRVVGVLGLAVPGHSWLTEDGEIYDLAYVRDTSPANWQSELQAAVLNGEADAAHAVATIQVADFKQRRTALAAPQPGVKETFLYRSELDLGDGIQFDDRKYAGRYQPYGAWFPEELPAEPPLVVFLHGAMSNHLSGAYGLEEGDAGLGPESLAMVTGQLDLPAVFVTPLGRAETFGWYAGAAEQDVLDVIADVQHRLGTDPDRVVITGYSLGGVGTFRLAQLYPDRWAGAVEIVGAHDLGALTLMEEAGGSQTLPNALENLRNLPFRMAHSRADELEILVGAVQPDLAALQLHQLGYDYRYWQFYLRSHINFPVPMIQCEIEKAIARGRAIDPPRVVYSQEPAIISEDPDVGLKLSHDSAYWMSEMVVRGDSFEPGDKGTVDITSLAMPDRVPLLEPVVGSDSNVAMGRDVCGPNPELQTNDIWTTQGQAWEGFEEQPISNAMVAELNRVASVRVDLQRMGLDVQQTLGIDLLSDGEASLRLQADWPGGVEVEATGALLCPADGVIDVPVSPGASSLVLKPAPCPG
jgi:pimeloyl-ACP methyl ester carboxylesterase